MDNQEVFNKIVRHLRKQGVQSMTQFGCRYRGDNNTKCAIGCLMEDDEYSPAFEGRSITSLLSVILIPKVYLNSASISKADIALLAKFSAKLKANLDFLSDCQRVHDDYDPSHWENKFKVIAKDYNLIVPEKE